MNSTVTFWTACAIAWAVLVCANARAEAVRWAVSVEDPASGVLHVSLRVPGEYLDTREYVNLTFPDARGGSGKVEAFEARTGTQAVRVVRDSTPRGAQFRVFPSRRHEELQIEYDVDSRFYPPGSDGGSRADARAILEPQLGVLRTRTIFASGFHVAYENRVSFDLPPGWLAVTPWRRDGDAFVVRPDALRDTEYLGIGPFEVTEMRVAGTPYVIATLEADQELIARLPALIETEHRIAGGPPRYADRIHSIILTPRGFIQGGSAGRRSVVQGPNAVTLAHEVFHWWNHSGVTTAEAQWFSEGFTEYFAIRAAEESGLLAAHDAQMCFADLYGEMRYLERDGAMSLAEASRRYGEREPQRIVYGKGALLAFWTDRKLAESGRELRELLPILFADPTRRHTNADMFDAFERAFDGALLDAFTTYVETAVPLPDLGLPEASGESGRARFLPESPVQTP